MPVYEKVTYLYDRKDQILCNYSTNYISELHEKFWEYFPDYPTSEAIDAKADEKELIKYLDDYFQNAFPKEFFNFSLWVAQSINWIKE